MSIIKVPEALKDISITVQILIDSLVHYSVYKLSRNSRDFVSFSLFGGYEEEKE
jgi:hypothetical protein